MARQVHVTLIDDLDGTPDAKTVIFGYDGKNYEIDLSDANAAKLEQMLEPYVEAGRKLGRGGRPSTTPRYNNTSKVREWANQNGYNVSSRGRIPIEVQQAYDKAHKA